MKPNPPHSHSQSAGSPGDRGFTLMEVLVVITIVVVLAGLILMIVSNVRKKAHQANALSSLRQVAAVSTAYSIENNGDINTLRWVGDPKEGGGNSWVRNSFWGRLQPYLFPEVSITDQRKLKEELERRLDNLFNTPDSNTMANTMLQGARIYHDGSGLPVPIGFNSNLHKWGQFLKVSSFSDPGSVIYAAYGYGFFNEEDGKSYVPIPKDKTIPKNNIFYQDDRRALASFLDGHIEQIGTPIPKRRFE